MKILFVILALGAAASDVSAAQSAPGEAIAHREAWSPAALSRGMVRDSARPWSRRYERGEQLSWWLQMAGGTLMLGSVWARLTQRRCKGSPFNDQRQCKVLDEVFLGGAALYFVSFGINWGPVKGVNETLVWHNRGQSPGRLDYER